MINSPVKKGDSWLLTRMGNVSFSLKRIFQNNENYKSIRIMEK